HLLVESRLLAQRHSQEARPQLRFERLAERVVLAESQRRDEFTQAELRTGNRETSRFDVARDRTRFTCPPVREERTMNELNSKGAGELAQMIASGEVTSTEVIDAHLARIEEVNPDLNAVTVTLADEARAAAAGVDQAVAAGAQLGPLAGVPF